MRTTGESPRGTQLPITHATPQEEPRMRRIMGNIQIISENMVTISQKGTQENKIIRRGSGALQATEILP